MDLAFLSNLASDFFYPHLRTCLLEGKGQREGGRETSTWEENTNRLPLIHAPTRTKPTTQACALAWNQTHDLLVSRTMLQPTELHWSGSDISLLNEVFRSLTFNVIIDTVGWNLPSCYLFFLCPTCCFSPFLLYLSSFRLNIFYDFTSSTFFICYRNSLLRYISGCFRAFHIHL